jgi:hypothetical protein
MEFATFGFFRELGHGSPGGPSLEQSRRETAQPDEENIANYLESAPAISVSGSMADDYFDPSKRAVAPLEIVSDGAWVWPRDLAYYVRHYHAALPPDFVAFMRQRGWQPPEFTRDELVRLTREVRDSLRS